MDKVHRSTLEWTLIVLILLVAAFLRFHDLGNIPRGLEHDEVATWHMVDQVLRGARPIYFEEGYGHEPLFNYFTALPVAVFGHNWLSLWPCSGTTGSANDFGRHGLACGPSPQPMH